MENLTPEQKSKLQQIDALLSQLNAELAAEQRQSIINGPQALKLIDETARYRRVFTKLKPVFGMFTGNTDMMSAMGELAPLLPTLQNDKDLITDLSSIVQSINAQA